MSIVGVEIKGSLAIVGVTEKTEMNYEQLPLGGCSFVALAGKHM